MTIDDDSEDRMCVEVKVDPMAEVDAALSDLEALLKTGEVGAVLADRGVNTSIALCAVSGVRSYLAGKKAESAEDLATAVEEIRSRLFASAPVDGAPENKH